jgi:hypothetical protein
MPCIIVGLQDRRRVYSILEGEGIEIPRYAVLDRDSPDPKRKFTAHNGQCFIVSVCIFILFVCVFLKPKA